MSLRKVIGAIPPRAAVVIHDLLMTALAWWLAKALRYMVRPEEVQQFGRLEFPIVLLIQV